MNDLDAVYHELNEALSLVRAHRHAESVGVALQEGIHRDVRKRLATFGGHLECRHCHTVRPLKYTLGRYLKRGWPMCCGETMEWLTEEQLADRSSGDR
jgi:hypothetical protein